MHMYVNSTVLNYNRMFMWTDVLCEHCWEKKIAVFTGEVTFETLTGLQYRVSGLIIMLTYSVEKWKQYFSNLKCYIKTWQSPTLSQMSNWTWRHVFELYCNSIRIKTKQRKYLWNCHLPLPATLVVSFNYVRYVSASIKWLLSQHH